MSGIFCMDGGPGQRRAAAAPGTVIAGRYQIVRQLGAGAMGSVYQARQLSMDRLVALKLIHPHVAASADAVRRFHREMQATSRIEHPGTIRVFDFGAAEDGQLYLAMEFLDGRPLSRLLAEAGPLPPPRLLHIATQIVRALGAAHEEGIAHRDLKPDNVMLLDRYGERDVVKVLDFGIARFVGDDAAHTQMTHDGAIIGTPAYMSPEQASGRAVDVRADFYSLGVMLYEMAVGKLPFAATSVAAMLVAHASEPPPAPSTVRPIAPALEAVILQLLAKEPAARPATAAELLRLLEACGEAAPAPAPRLARQRAITPPPTTEDLPAVSATALPSTSPSSPSASPSSPSPSPSSSPSAPSPPASRRVGWAAALAAAVVAVAAAALALTQRRPSDAPAALAARAQFDALVAADGDPAPPPSCRAHDRALVERLARATALLQGSTIGAPRPQDRDALTLLAPHPPAADAATEYWALLSRAHLVVDDSADDALAAARTAVARCPGSAVAHAAVGNAEQRAGHADAARAAYDQARTLAPTWLTPRYDLGLLALRAGDAAAALAAFDEVLRKDPLHPHAHRARGQANLQLGHVQAALDDLEQATLRDRSDAGAWLLLGEARARAGAPKTAREAFCQAKALGNADGARLCP